MGTTRKIAQLRKLMAERQIDAYVVPSADPHQSEYVAEHWKRRAWISGFTGSAGTAAFTQNAAGLWTDGRYFIQAEQELAGSGIGLFKTRAPDEVKLIDWLCANVPEGGCVGIDGRQLTVETAKEWEQALEKKRIRLATDLDLISPLWRDRPTIPGAPVVLHPVDYSGRTTAQNLAEIRAAMKAKEAGYHLLSSLSDIAWLLNIRGGDIPHCPVAMCFVLLSQDGVRLFIDRAKISDEVHRALAADGVAVDEYGMVAAALEALPPNSRILLDERRTNLFLRRRIPAGCTVVNAKDPTDLPKARKNAVQLGHWKRTMEIDGVAMVRFWKWLEGQMPNGGLTEYAAAKRLEAIRRNNRDCRDLSFPSISAYGPNAAIMHYAPKPEACAAIEPRGLYLIDSGGQYFGGTTDITRTLAMGATTEEQSRDYTLVLKGLIALSTAQFLKGATGANLDALARRPLWERGIDYKSGTGHGVGYYLNVHEGPQNISQSMKSDAEFEPGMVVTIEPGVYREGRHGIRIENMVCVEEAERSESGIFLRFATLTLCPIDTVPIERGLMDAREIEWLDRYHAEVYARLAPLLGKDEAAWLAGKTKAL